MFGMTQLVKHNNSFMSSTAKCLVIFLLLVNTKALSQVEVDSTKCVTLYENEKDWSLAINDTCLVSLALGGTNDKDKKKYKVSALLAKVKNLYVLTIQTPKTLEIKQAFYDFKYLYDVYIKGCITNSTFPVNFFSSKVLAVINLNFLNKLDELPNAIMTCKASGRGCHLIINANPKFGNNAKSLVNDILKLIEEKRYNKLEFYHCKFNKSDMNKLKNLAEQKLVNLNIILY